LTEATDQFVSADTSVTKTMSKPGVSPTASKVLPKRRHSISAIATSSTSSSPPPPPIVTKQDKQRMLSVPNGNFNHERRRGSLIPIGESEERLSGVSPALPSVPNARRRSVVVISPPLDEKLSTSRSTSRRTSMTTNEEISADQLINEYVREVDEAAIRGNRRDSLPQASDEFASVMNEMANNIAITVNIA